VVGPVQPRREPRRGHLHPSSPGQRKLAVRFGTAWSTRAIQRLKADAGMPLSGAYLVLVSPDPRRARTSARFSVIVRMR
jgi:hypothetical protein